MKQFLIIASGLMLSALIALTVALALSMLAFGAAIKIWEVV